MAGVRGSDPHGRARAARARAAADPAIDRERFAAAFLEPPLHSTEHAQGFGTIYTAVYEPARGRVEYRWPGTTWEQSFDRFTPGARGVVLPVRPS